MASGTMSCIALYTSLPVHISFTATGSRQGRKCCGNAEQSVFLAGSIKGTSIDELEAWLRKLTPLHFVHITKSEDLGWGHVHFASHGDASVFYYEMKGKFFAGPSNGDVRFSSARQFGSMNPVKYMTVCFLFDTLDALFILVPFLYQMSRTQRS
jgi:hypothetical protein